MAGPSYGYVQPPVAPWQRPTSGLAITGLILAVIPFTTIFGLILSFIAIFLTGPNSERKGRGLAIGGVVAGIVWSVLWGCVIYMGVQSMSFLMNEAPKVLMYGMEIRIEKFKEVEGRYPATMDEFWHRELGEVDIGDGSAGQRMDLSGMDQVIEYKLGDTTGRPWRLYSRDANVFDGVSEAPIEHQYGVNPLPELRAKLEKAFFMGEDDVEQICESIQRYFNDLREKPFYRSMQPAPLPDGAVTPAPTGDGAPTGQ